MPYMWISKKVKDTCYKNRDTVDAKGNPRIICHHIDLNHDNNDPDNLIFLSKREHDTLHGKLSKGKKRSAEHRAKISASNKGRHWYTNGIVDKFVSECPDGFVKGRLDLRWYNNGIVAKFARECPHGFVPGMLRKKEKSK